MILYCTGLSKCLLRPWGIMHDGMDLVEKRWQHIEGAFFLWRKSLPYKYLTSGRALARRRVWVMAQNLYPGLRVLSPFFFFFFLLFPLWRLWFFVLCLTGVTGFVNGWYRHGNYKLLWSWVHVCENVSYVAFLFFFFPFPVFCLNSRVNCAQTLWPLMNERVPGEGGIEKEF